MPGTSESQVREDVLAAQRAYLDAVARKDAAAVFASYAENPVSFEFPPPLEVRESAADGEQSLQSWFDTWEGTIGTELRPQDVEVSGDLAVVFGLQRLYGRKYKEGQLSMWYRSTTVLVRRGSEWRIKHIHNSVPMAMDGSGKALTDLQPPAATR